MKLWSKKPKLPTAVTFSWISCRKFLISARDLEIRGEGTVSNREEIGKEPSSLPSPTLNNLSINQEETTKITVCLHSQIMEFMANRWETILPHTEDNLPAHIKGAAEWIEYHEPNWLCYVVYTPGNALEEWPVELINGDWYLLTWENIRWRTQVIR